MRQMGKLLTEQPSERVVPIAGAREEVLDALRRGNEELRPAALAAQRLRVLVAGRLPGQIAEQLMAALDWRLTMDKDTVSGPTNHTCGCSWPSPPQKMTTAPQQRSAGSHGYSQSNRRLCAGAAGTWLPQFGDALMRSARFSLRLRGRGASMQLRCWPGGT